MAQTEWDNAYTAHLATLRDVWARTKVAVARALPLIEDDEPLDLLELLERSAPTESVQPRSSTLQEAAINSQVGPRGNQATAGQGGFGMPESDRHVAR